MPHVGEAGSVESKRHVFLCHATADKAAYIHPLTAALLANGITYWIDEGEINWGDRITEKINSGLVRSQYVIVFLTKAFLKSQWPQTEMDNALNREATTGEMVVLPILAAPEAEVFEQYPLLKDKLCLRWEDGADSIIRALQKLLGIQFKPHWSFSHPASYSGQVWLQLIAKPENEDITHKYVIRWGRWKYNGTLNFGGLKSLTLVHTKGNDGLSVPIMLDVHPPCYVLLGQGSPSGTVQDINHGWVRVEDN